MKYKFSYLQLILLSVTLFFTYAACNRHPDDFDDYRNVKGYVIGKETCHADETKDYWLVDLTYLPDAPQYGDTLLLNGATYTNVIKTKDLSERLKELGMTVSLDYRTITPKRVETTGCDVASPVTYRLKELTIENQFEIR